jgi:hypothetical protein
VRSYSWYDVLYTRLTISTSIIQARLPLALGWFGGGVGVSIEGGLGAAFGTGRTRT